MRRHVINLILVIGIWLVVVAVSGCADHDDKRDKQYVARIEDRVVTAHEFEQAFEIDKTAYPPSALKHPDFVKKARVRLLGEMVEEMILLHEAENLNITISDTDLDQAVADIKRDYPEGAFEETLLKNAISYHVWEKRLKNRLTIEKLIAEELEAKIDITPEDIAGYYKKDNIGNDLISDKEGTSNISDMIIKYLRKQKSEQAYRPWIIGLKNKYTIEINSN